MKVMAIGTLATVTNDQMKKYMPAEVPATLQLYLDGKLEQFWLRENNAGVIFLLDVQSVEDAKSSLQRLPLAKEGLLTYELLPVGPLLPLGMLIRA